MSGRQEHKTTDIYESTLVRRLIQTKPEVITFFFFFNFYFFYAAVLTDVTMIFRLDLNISPKQISFRYLHDSVSFFTCNWEWPFCCVVSYEYLADLHLTWLRGLSALPANSPEKPQGKCARQNLHPVPAQVGIQSTEQLSPAEIQKNAIGLHTDLQL